MGSKKEAFVYDTKSQTYESSHARINIDALYFRSNSRRAPERSAVPKCFNTWHKSRYRVVTCPSSHRNFVTRSIFLPARSLSRSGLSSASPRSIPFTWGCLSNIAPRIANPMGLVLLNGAHRCTTYKKRLHVLTSKTSRNI